MRLTSVEWTVAWLAGTWAGLSLLARIPSGLDQRYGWALIALCCLAAVPLWQLSRLVTGKRACLAQAICLLACIALAACGRAMLTSPPATPLTLSYYNDLASARHAAITGIISADPVLGDRWQRLRVSAASLVLAGPKLPLGVSGDMYALVSRYPIYSLGERIALTGTLTTPPTMPGFDYPAYLARLGVTSYMLFPSARSLGPGEPSGFLAREIADARHSVRSAIEASLPEPEASLTVGIVTGDRTSIPGELEDAFRQTGSTHILAISGQNISLLVGVIWLLFGVRGRRRRMPAWLFLLACLLLVVYTAFTGATPSVVRAAIMGLIVLAAPLVGRRYDPIAALSVTAAAMVALDPDVLLDAGFQLSYSAMLGICLLGPAFSRMFARLPHQLELLWLALAASLSAQAATLPLSVMLMGQVSPVSPLATLSVEWVLLPLMLAGIVAGLLGSIVPAVGLLAWPWAAWMVLGVRLWASVPFASLQVSGAQPVWALAYYAVAAIAYTSLIGKSRSRGAIAALMIAGLAVAAWTILVGVLLVN